MDILLFTIMEFYKPREVSIVKYFRNFMAKAKNSKNKYGIHR